MRIIHIFVLLLFFPLVQAQKMLSIDEAVNIALKNNFDILVARNDADIAKINNTRGNAGMLPTLQLTGSGNYKLNTIKQLQDDGSESRISSTSITAGTELAWTLYDGGKMFVTKNKLNEMDALGEIQFKEQVLQTLYGMIAVYYDVVRQKQQLNSINEAINYNRERVKIAQTGFDGGSLIKSDLLQAKIDLNVSLENAINQKFTIEAAKKNLNVLLGQSGGEVVETSDVIPLDYIPDKTALFQKLNASNSSIQSFQKQIEIAQLVLSENKSAYLPTVNFNAGYYATQTANSVGSIPTSRSLGPQLGGTVIVPIYSSGENRRKTSIAKKQIQTAEYNLENLKLQMNTQLQNTLTDFDNQQQLMQIEKENNNLTKENLQISLQRLRLGQTTSLEVHQAQEDYVQSCTRLINFQYNLKIAETKLKQLVSSL
jgi:outer membrane protein